MMNVESASVVISGIFEFVQDASLVLVLTMLGFVIVFMERNKEYRSKATWVLFLLLHASIFYTCVFIVREGITSIENPTLIFTNWSSVLRLHSYIVMSVLCFYIRGRIQGKSGKT